MNRHERQAIATFPRAASVRLLHVAKTRRERRRDRVLSAVYCAAVVLFAVVYFYRVTN